MKGIQLELELQLDQVERQIGQLLGQNEANWKEVAKLAILTQQKELYREKYRSFTAWVNSVAQQCDRQPSLIWRYIKASRYYLQQVGSDDLEQIGEIKAAPEALERLEKVQRQAPLEVFDRLREKVLAGDATVAQCRQVEKDYRPLLEAPTNRGRPVKEEQGTYQHLGKQRDWEAESAAAAEDEVLPPVSGLSITRDQTAPTIVRSLKINLVDWTSNCAGMKYPPRNYNSHEEIRINVDKKRRRIDFLAVVRWSLKRPKDLFAVEIKSCLHDFETDKKWVYYLQFCHYFCFACSSTNSLLISAIETATPATVGIIGIDLGATIQADLSYPVKVIRKPQRLAGDRTSQVYETLYERVLGWSGKDEDEEES